MTKRLRSGLVSVLLVAVIGMLLAGCGNFRQQALEAQSRLDEAVQQAETAETAAARNAGLILDLERRIEALEDALADVKASIDTSETKD
jgi:uncharacterized protein HemX